MTPPEIPPPPPQAGAVQTELDDTQAEVTGSYAEALLSAAKGTASTDEVIDELEEIVAQVFRAQPRFAAIFEAPTVPPAAKDRVLTETFEGRVSPLVLSFLRVLNRHNRIDLLGSVVRQARILLDRRSNRRPVSVRSAVPLNDAEQSALADRLSQLIKATPVFRFEVDPTLIAGLVVQVGDDVYDASGRNHLDLLRRSLIEGKTHEISSRRNQFSDPA